MDPVGRHQGRRLLGIIGISGALVAVSLALVVPQVGAVLSAHQAAPIDLSLNPLAQRSIVLAADGHTILGSLHGDQNRQVISIREIPPVVVATVLAVEDRNFFHHGGIDLRSMVRALFSNVQAGGVRQGGSTITQQLVKNALLDGKRQFGRKLKEAALAIRLDHQLTKRQILERYLNTVYLGNGTYGVQAAAETYFGKQAKELDAADAALLAGLIKNPEGYDPFRHAARAEQRRAEVVGRLRAVRAVDSTAAGAILATPLPSAPHTLLPAPDDYFVNEVARRLLHDRVLGRTATARYDAVFAGGLTIKTTLDPRLQQLAVDAVRHGLPDTHGRFTAALVSVDPTNGAVRALVGGPGFERSKYDIATQGVGRQVGSSMKPIVLATALEQGISPRSTIAGSSPCTFKNPGGTPDPYSAENFEGERAGVLNLYDATKHSINCAYLRLGQIVGLDNVVSMAKRLGISTPIEPNLSLPLGTSEIRPIEMAGAYATFAADGVYHQPYFIRQVLDRHGKVLFDHDATGHRVLSSEVAHEVTDVLRGVITGGTGTAARFADRRPAAGKTGTTSDHSDAWFVGYTPQLATAVWMGSPVGRVEMRGVGGVRKVTGGSFPARIWQAFMGPAHAGLAEEDFPAPDVVTRGRYLRLSSSQEVHRYRRRTTATTVPPPPAPATGQTGGGA